MSLQATETECAANAAAPRVSLADIEDAIAGEIYATGADAFGVSPYEPLGILTLCAITMKNGFTIIGKSAPASRANFNVDIGRKLAHEDAIRQIWPLMGFALRDRLASGEAQ